MNTDVSGRIYKLSTLVLAFLICASVLFCWHMSKKVEFLEARIDFQEVIRTGRPIEYLDNKNYKPYRKIPVVYENQEAELLQYRSSGTSWARSHDFIIIVNKQGIIVVAFEYETLQSISAVLNRLEADLSSQPLIDSK